MPMHGANSVAKAWRSVCCDDVELHTTMYTTYHPGTIVRWDALKTRGDHLCKFRVSIPELMSPNDPQHRT